MESQARIDRAHGRVSSDEELAKNTALWRGAGFQGPCPGVPAEDQSVASWASHIPDAELNHDAEEEEQAVAGGREGSDEPLEGAGEVEDEVPPEDEVLHMLREEVPPGDAMVLQDEPLLDDDLALGDGLLLDDVLEDLGNHSEGSGGPLRHEDSGIVIDDLALGHQLDDLASDGGFEDRQELYDDDEDFRMIDDYDIPAQDLAASPPRPVSPAFSAYNSPRQSMSPPGTPPLEDWSEVNARDLFEPLHDDPEPDFDNGYSSESSVEEHDEFFDFEDHDDHDDASGDPEDEDEILPVNENDPLYAHAEDLFDDDDDDNDAVQADRLPPAFHEDPLLRRAYVQAFISATSHGTTKDGVAHFLTSTRSNYASIAQRCPAAQIPGLGTMAVTLRTVERRLGVDPDQRILYFFVCDTCWYRHHPSELYKLEHSGCTQPGCLGTLYITKMRDF
ncbi:hypothetical protein OH76DRAFT_1508102 [Lentinus brumalis]|uniref:Uncharacterized protein n=1 Tax=Lentinus brumalis TaxID=2498619 RepID=A0A371CJ28_9APHY|nr:hypothetical protein OH76DRAFT_1508102 [Polyporus brumalis]